MSEETVTMAPDGTEPDGGMRDVKTTRHFSLPLLKQTTKSNLTLTIVVIIISCLLCFIIAFAMGVIGDIMASAGATDATAFNYYLTAVLDKLYPNGLSNVTTEEIEEILAAFEDLYTGEIDMAVLGETEVTLQWFQEALDASLAANPSLSYMFTEDGLGYLFTLDEFYRCMSFIDETAEIEAYISNFEYYYVLAFQGAFNVSMDTSGVMQNMMGIMGMGDMMESMQDVSVDSMINLMYFHEIGILPLLIWIVVVGNSIVCGQVDRGSMAYVLSTPTTRSAVVTTQAVYMIIVPFITVLLTCCVKLACNAGFNDEVNAGETITLFVGMYLLIESMSGICFRGSCLFNRNARAMAFGGGLVVLFFLASLIGMFGSDMMVNVGMGVEALNAFNYISLMTLLDVDAIGTIGTESVNFNFLWEFAILLVIAVATYIIGSARFTRKDLPL